MLKGEIQYTKSMLADNPNYKNTKDSYSKP